MGIILFIFLLLVGLGVAAYFFLNSPIDNNSSKGDNDDYEDDDYEDKDEDEDEDEDYEDDDEDEEDDEEDEDSVHQGDASLTTKTVGNTTSTQDPTQTVSMEDTVQQVCTPEVVGVNPFCDGYKYFVFDLGKAGDDYGDVEMILAIDGVAKSSIDQVRVFLWFSDDMKEDYIPSGIKGNEHTFEYNRRTQSIDFEIPFEAYWNLFEDGRVLDGYKTSGLLMDGFDIFDEDSKTLQLRQKLQFKYKPDTKKLEWFREDLIVEREKDAYNEKVRNAVHNQKVYWDDSRGNYEWDQGGSETFSKDEWVYKEDKDGYFTPHHTDLKAGSNSMDDVAWPRGFRFGGRSNEDRDHRVYEIRWVPGKDETYGIYKGSSTDWKSALGVTSKGRGNKGRPSSDYNNSGHRFTRTIDGKPYIVHRNIVEKSNSWGIWGSQESWDAPANIYLAFEPNDTEFWKNKLPTKPQRKSRRDMVDTADMKDDENAAAYILV